MDDKNILRVPIRTYVLRAGRLTEAQRRSYEELSEAFCISFKSELLNYSNVFGNNNPVIIEIGFGMGKATALIAQQNPHINYIGIEVHTPGVGKLLYEIKKNNLQNIRIIQHDAVEVLEHMIPNNSVSAFHVFFPDPWPKKKHHKRRFMQNPRTNLLASKLFSGGYIYMVTDWEPYGEFALEELTKIQELKNIAQKFAPKQEWRPETRFEEKGIKAQRNICELYFTKK